MQLARPAIAIDPRRFGRGQLRDLGSVEIQTSSISADLKLFATTFLAGFVFVSVLIG
jgi:hypothetical protein